MSVLKVCKEICRKKNVSFSLLTISYKQFVMFYISVRFKISVSNFLAETHRTSDMFPPLWLVLKEIGSTVSCCLETKKNNG